MSELLDSIQFGGLETDLHVTGPHLHSWGW